LDGTGRTGKFQKKTRSDAQTESAFPPALFVEYLFGIEVLSPGMKNLKIRPVLSGVRELAGEFPTPEGMLSLAWKFKKDGRGNLKLEVPGEMEICIDLSGLVNTGGRTFTFDKEELSFDKADKAQLVVRKGIHELLF